MFSKLVEPRSTGTLMVEINDLSSRVHDRDITEDVSPEISLDDSDTIKYNPKLAKVMPDGLRQAFRVVSPHSHPTHAHFVSNTTISGFVHSTRQKHQGNCQVMFSPTDGSTPIPGFIDSIFTVENDPRQFLAVHRLLSSSSSNNDPFRHWPFLGVKLYDNALGYLEVIPVANVDFQFACCPLIWEEADVLAVVSLSKVSSAMACFSVPTQISLFFRTKRLSVSPRRRRRTNRLRIGLRTRCRPP